MVLRSSIRKEWEVSAKAFLREIRLGCVAFQSFAFSFSRLDEVSPFNLLAFGSLAVPCIQGHHARGKVFIFPEGISRQLGIYGRFGNHFPDIQIPEGLIPGEIDVAVVVADGSFVDKLLGQKLNIGDVSFLLHPKKSLILSLRKKDHPTPGIVSEDLLDLVVLEVGKELFVSNFHHKSSIGVFHLKHKLTQVRSGIDEFEVVECNRLSIESQGEILHYLFGGGIPKGHPVMAHDEDLGLIGVELYPQIISFIPLMKVLSR